MDINKAQWQADGDNLRLSMPLTKVDKENRLVSGWASLDNADSQGDIVMSDASQKAFARFRGNIREMHQPVAVGKMVDFREDSYYDTETKKFYKGIYATVYVSKGAPDTWEKVLDGTLTGFSIGGNIIDSETQFVKDAGKPIRFVKDYELVELSLVDSPANELANIFSITKANDGTLTMKGMVTEVKTETVFYCEKDGIAKTSDEQALDCGNCGTTMSNIGWFEYNSDEEKVDKMTTLVEKHNSSQENAKQVLPATIEGGVDVAEENENADEQIVAGSAAPAVVPAGEEGQAQTEVDSSNEAVADNAEVKVDDEAVNDSTEKAADVSEVEVEEPDFAKMFGDLQSAIETGLVKTRESATADIAKATEAFEAKITELVGKHDELTNKFDSLKTELDSVEKRVDGVESETAVKKSGDLGGSTEDTLSKSKGTSKWGGRFLGISALEQ